MAAKSTVASPLVDIPIPPWAPGMNRPMSAEFCSAFLVRQYGVLFLGVTETSSLLQWMPLVLLDDTSSFRV